MPLPAHSRGRAPETGLRPSPFMRGHVSGGIEVPRQASVPTGPGLWCGSPATTGNGDDHPTLPATGPMAGAGSLACASSSLSALQVTLQSQACSGNATTPARSFPGAGLRMVRELPGNGTQPANRRRQSRPDRNRGRRGQVDSSIARAGCGRHGALFMPLGSCCPTSPMSSMSQSCGASASSTSTFCCPAFSRPRAFCHVQHFPAARSAAPSRNVTLCPCRSARCRRRFRRHPEHPCRTPVARSRS